ncbi:MAG: right-handed parallel beta-helix repeat-containing protein [bacterium]|nr:right-handed parallel beta-helix repeat-containing protein [bacterium]
MKAFLFLAILSTAICVSVSASAAIWYVDGSVSSSGDGKSWEKGLKTIQQGINAASHGDTVTVAEGVYLENIQFNGKNIILTSTDPLDSSVVANTIIDGNKAGSVVTFSGKEDESCVLAGFTIRNGSAEIGSGIRGGTWENETHASIRNNVVSGNTSRYHAMAFCGGTIESNTICDNSGNGLRYCNGTIRENAISANSSSGLYSCDGIVERNTISANAAAGLEQCHGTVQKNTISGNSQRGLDSCHGTIRNNVITGNSWGGLMNCNGTIENNTIHRNPAWGLHSCEGTIRNCIIWGNWPLPAGGQLWGCTEPSYCCIQDWTGGGAGNIPFNPHFVDAEKGDFHLRSWSPCVDAGDPASAFSEEPQPNGGRVNMGAYGNTPEAASGSPDTDSDELPDEWELHWFGDLRENGAGDPDSDYISNLTEYHHARNPNSAADPRTNNATKDTWYVSIQEALSGCDDGDEILVYPGLYVENISFEGKNAILRSTDPSDETIVASTIIEAASGLFPVVRFDGTEDETCALSGFTIRNGGGGLGGGIRGGTQDVHTHATIRDNIIRGNSVPRHGQGGGLACCDGLIENNTIAENSASRPFDGGGGLAFCDGTIRNNRITKNTAGMGGGLVSCGGSIENNTITGNSADEGGGLAFCGGTVQNNTIASNRADSMGGGLDSCLGSIQNNLIVGNYARWGGGLYDCNGSIQSNTIAHNSAEDSAGGLRYCAGGIRNCIIWGNTGEQLDLSSTPSFSCVEGWTGGGRGNINDNPLFGDPVAGDYHLQADSPCIDAGANYYWFAWPQRDFDGNCRLAGGRMDMGCYEHDSSLDSDGDLLSDDMERALGTDHGEEDMDGDGLRDGLEILRGSNPNSATPPGILHVPSHVASIQASLCFAVEGDEIVVAPGLYPENLLFCLPYVILRSYDPGDSHIVASTIIDGGDSGPALSFTGSESEACVLSGFTITGGQGVYGGGICGGTEYARTHARIEKNIITGNSASHGGGLAYCDGVVRSNTISGNSATGASSNGGGLYECDGTIEDNTIAGNLATFQGGGLYSCHGTIQNNAITGNRASWYGGGLDHCGGLVRDNAIVQNSALDGGGASGCDGTIVGNIITGNSADASGGGLAGCDGAVESNVIAGNSAGDGGGGLAGCDGAVRNNTITGNSASDWGGGLYECYGPIRICVIWGNEAPAGSQVYFYVIHPWDPPPAPPEYSCIQDWTGGGEGNISDDPRFVDAANGDFRLSADSPCIDAGFNSTDLPETDIVGMHRIMFGGKSLTVDMGAYEFHIWPPTENNQTGEIALRWSSRSGKAYSVYHSGDMLSWDILTDNVPSAGDTVTTWIDSMGPALPPGVRRRYYKVMENQ